LDTTAIRFLVSLFYGSFESIQKQDVEPSASANDKNINVMLGSK